MVQIIICDRCGQKDATDTTVYAVRYTDHAGEILAVHERTIEELNTDLCESCYALISRCNGEGYIPIRVVNDEVEFDTDHKNVTGHVANYMWIEEAIESTDPRKEQVMFGETYGISDRFISPTKANHIPKQWQTMMEKGKNAKYTILATNGLTVATMSVRDDGTSFIDPHALHTAHTKNSIGIGFDSIKVVKEGTMFYMREKKVYLISSKSRGEA